MSLGHRDDVLQGPSVINGATWVVWINDDDCACSVADEFFNVTCIRDETILSPAIVVAGDAAIERYGRTPKRVIRARHQHLVARIQKCSQRQVDQLANTISNEYFLCGNTLNAAILLLHHNRFARGEDAFLVAIRFRLAEVFDHCEAHGFGRAKSEQTRVADVQRDNLVAAFFQFQGVIRELTANFIANVLEDRAGLDWMVHIDDASQVELAKSLSRSAAR